MLSIKEKHLAEKKAEAAVGDLLAAMGTRDTPPASAGWASPFKDARTMAPKPVVRTLTYPDAKSAAPGK